MKQKKMIYSLIFVLLIVVIVLNVFTVKEQKITQDEKKFRLEYEKYNGTKNLSGVRYLSVEIPEANGISYVSVKQVIKLLESGTGVIYFGYPQSTWSRHILPSLFEAREEVGIDTIYYYNAYADRDEKRLDEDGVIQTIKEGTTEYYKILELLGDYADRYEGLEDDSIKRLYFPTIVFVKDGKIKDVHVSTVLSHQNEKKNLTKKQKKELQDIYKKAMRKIKWKYFVCFVNNEKEPK